MILANWLLWASIIADARAFLSSSEKGISYSSRNSRSPLFGIAEWRDSSFSSEGGAATPSLSDANDPLVRPISVLPTLSNQVLLPGETKYMQFVDDEQVRLFQKTIDHRDGTFGLGLLMAGGESVLDIIPLVEIEDYTIMEDTSYGIFAKIRAVGRARLVEISQQEPFVEALCYERFNDDSLSSSLDLANDMASTVESLIADISDIEASSPIINDGESDSRMTRYKAAYEAALSDGNQGGFITSNQGSRSSRSLQELAAISWAAFSTSECLAKDATFRLNALDNDNVVDRLEFAMHWLTDVRLEVEELVR